MSEEWGPVIQHDGKGCPLSAGTIIHSFGEWPDGRPEEFVGPVNPKWAGWDWSNGSRIIRYRIRKPRALLDMIERARELDDAPQGPVRVPGKEVVG